MIVVQAGELHWPRSWAAQVPETNEGGEAPPRPPKPGLAFHKRPLQFEIRLRRRQQWDICRRLQTVRCSSTRVSLDCRRSRRMPSFAVPVAEQGVHFGSRVRDRATSEHDGRTTPSNTAIRRPAGFVEGNCDLPQTDVRTVQRCERRGEMPVTVTCMTGLARCTRPGRTYDRGWRALEQKRATGGSPH